MSTNKLRSSIRRRRLQIPAAQQRQHASLVCKNLSRLRQFQKAGRIALYLSANGELDPTPIAKFSRRASKQLYLPVLHPFRHGRLFFCEWREHAPLQPNRFGILEPCCHGNAAESIRSLDLILVPLVAFDASAQRIGMGGGYYDRTLGKPRGGSTWKRPYLIGIAHEMQRVAAITPQPWDVQLDAVVTEAGVYWDKF
ncbi:MAG: 5-formyltetrahydrofolate cyclo-ligase [Pseudomonadota bacterium]|nr:5-formyltetrahydrofolate cyclo-ligase [Pseudomonadota bacterium]